MQWWKNYTKSTSLTPIKKEPSQGRDRRPSKQAHEDQDASQLDCSAQWPKQLHSILPLLRPPLTCHSHWTCPDAKASPQLCPLSFWLLDENIPSKEWYNLGAETPPPAPLPPPLLSQFLSAQTQMKKKKKCNTKTNKQKSFKLKLKLVQLALSLSYS